MFRVGFFIRSLSTDLPSSFVGKERGERFFPFLGFWGLLFEKEREDTKNE